MTFFNPISILEPLKELLYNIQIFIHDSVLVPDLVCALIHSDQTTYHCHYLGVLSSNWSNYAHTDIFPHCPWVLRKRALLSAPDTENTQLTNREQFWPHRPQLDMSQPLPSPSPSLDSLDDSQCKGWIQGLSIIETGQKWRGLFCIFISVCDRHLPSGELSSLLTAAAIISTIKSDSDFRESGTVCLIFHISTKIHKHLFWQRRGKAERNLFFVVWLMMRLGSRVALIWECECEESGWNNVVYFWGFSSQIKTKLIFIEPRKIGQNI